MATATASIKHKIRKEILLKRSQLSTSDHTEKSDAIVQRLRRFVDTLSPRIVHSYIPMRGEVDVLPLLVETAALADRTLYVPHVVDAQPDSMLHAEVSNEVIYKKGVLSTPTITKPIDVISAQDLAMRMKPTDVVLVPLVAFDETGYRLGYGGGFYDSFLRQVHCMKVGVAFDLQGVDAVPREVHDIRLDTIVTESHVHRCLPLI